MRPRSGTRQFLSEEVKVKLRILSGAKQGVEFVSSKPIITIGRHPDNDFQFDPDEDLDVSARHARLVLRDGKWHIEDLGSSNGTLLNGFAISATTRIDDTDQIRFGSSGPNTEIRFVKDSVTDGTTGERDKVAPTVAPRKQAPPRETAQSTTPPPTPPASATQRIRIEVRKQTEGLRRLTIALLVTLVAVAAAFFVLDRNNQRQRAAVAAAMRSRVDSILEISAQAVASLQGQMAGMREALQRSQTDVRRLQTSLNEAQLSGDAELVSRLQGQLSAATSALSSQRTAAQVDFNAVYEANQRAIAMIYVEFAPGHIETGTAFAVRPDGTMLTNRHVVAGPGGNLRATRLGIKFADSRQVFPAHIVAVSVEADLAVIRVEVGGEVPIVQGLADAAGYARPGQPTAIIGFPLGTDLPMTGEGSDQIARTTLTVGTVSKALADNVQVDAWGAEGSSGSPIFDSRGQVISILYGGQPGTGGKVIFGVPVSFAKALLDAVD